jgi:hypothetical protein
VRSRSWCRCCSNSSRRPRCPTPRRPAAVCRARRVTRGAHERRGSRGARREGAGRRGAVVGRERWGTRAIPPGMRKRWGVAAKCSDVCGSCWSWNSAPRICKMQMQIHFQHLLMPCWLLCAVVQPFRLRRPMPEHFFGGNDFPSARLQLSMLLSHVVQD